MRSHHGRYPVLSRSNADWLSWTKAANASRRCEEAAGAKGRGSGGHAGGPVGGGSDRRSRRNIRLDASCWRHRPGRALTLSLPSRAVVQEGSAGAEWHARCSLLRWPTLEQACSRRVTAARPPRAPPRSRCATATRPPYDRPCYRRVGAGAARVRRAIVVLGRHSRLRDAVLGKRHRRRRRSSRRRR